MRAGTLTIKMAGAQTDAEAWKRMVLRNMPAPSWLAQDAPHNDVVLSSRARYMRNLRGHRFPNACDKPGLRAAMKAVLTAAHESNLGLDVLKGISNAERDHLVGCRLVSPDFPWSEQGRALLLDPSRTLSLMVNEEDHLRLQALTAGWSIDAADGVASHYLSSIGKKLEFAFSEDFGYLSASPFNAGEGRRLSCMLHLIGLAQNRRLPSVLKALTTKGLAARGLFGESSRAVGAFLQVSVLQGTRSEFVGAVEYLIREERLARQALSRDHLEGKAAQAVEFAVVSRTVSLADALRVLAWVRWASSGKIPGFVVTPREVDAFLTTLEIRGDEEFKGASRLRAEALRQLVGH